MSNSAEVDKTAYKQDDAESDPLTEEEIADIQEYMDSKTKKIKFKTAEEFIRWLNE